MFLSGITFGLTNCSSLRNDPELSEHGMEMETLLECTQETTRKETKVTFGHEESVSMEIVDTETIIWDRRKLVRKWWKKIRNLFF